MSESIAVFFDVQNLYHSSKLYGGSKISYKDLIGKITEGRELRVANAYAAHRSEKDVSSFHKALKSSNINVVCKRIGFRKNREEEVSQDKGKLIPVHFDVEIATDALMAKFDHPDLNTVVLCTGNGTFGYLVEALTSLGLNVEVWSFTGSTSKDLTELCTKFVEIPKECLLAARKPEETSVNAIR